MNEHRCGRSRSDVAALLALKLNVVPPDRPTSYHLHQEDAQDQWWALVAFSP